jgi:hypothetical protein
MTDIAHAADQFADMAAVAPAPAPTEANAVSAELDTARQLVNTDSYPMSVGELVNIYKARELKIDPEFQRLFRWSPQQKSNLIESLLIGIPVPPIFLFERPNGVWELIDGLQRTSTLLEFLGELRRTNSDEMAPPSQLVGTQYIPDLEGVCADEACAAKLAASKILPRALLTQLKRAKIGLQILKASSSEKSKFEVFQRLNGGGSLLTPQELRTCIMVMHSPHRHKMISISADKVAFRNLTSVTEEGRARQEHLDYYCRAIAHLTMPFEKKFDLDEYINVAVTHFLDGEEDQFSDCIDAIDETAELLYSIEPNILRRYEEDTFRGRTGKVAFETIFMGVAANLRDILALPDPKGYILSRAKEIWSGGTLSGFVSAGVTSTSRIQKTIPLGKGWFQPNADNNA